MKLLSLWFPIAFLADDSHPCADRNQHLPNPNLAEGSIEGISPTENEPQPIAEQAATMNQEKNLSAKEKVNAEWDGMAGEWDDMAAGYAAGFHSVLWNKLGIDDPSTLTVLDFGCGTGLLTERLKDQVARVIALDASPKMVEMLQDKIDTRPGFANVTALSGILANLEDDSGETNDDFQKAIADLEGTIDLIVASSVLNFVPEDDLKATCQVLGRLLKPTSGILYHTDWPAGDGQAADGMTTEKAERMYAMAGGLVTQSTTVEKLQMGKDEADVFFGIAKKP